MIIDYLGPSRQRAARLLKIGVLLAVVASVLQFASLPLLVRHIGPDWLEVGFPIVLALLSLTLLLRIRLTNGAEGWNTWGQAGVVLACLVCLLPVFAYWAFLAVLSVACSRPGSPCA
jgi:hypothetical protein